MDFWATVGIAAAISTALATGVSTLAALWWRRMDRTEADWALMPHGHVPADIDRVGNPVGHAAGTDVANAGDGTAFRVAVRGENCEPVFRVPNPPGSPIPMRSPELLPVMAPGDEVYLHVKCELPNWDDAVVFIEWTRSPTWRKKRSRRTLRIPIGEIATKPTESEPPPLRVRPR